MLQPRYNTTTSAMKPTRFQLSVRGLSTVSTRALGRATAVAVRFPGVCLAAGTAGERAAGASAGRIAGDAGVRATKAAAAGGDALAAGIAAGGAAAAGVAAAGVAAAGVARGGAGRRASCSGLGPGGTGAPGAAG